tara:strand:+ start:1079 stop:1351 length:273 start_codon:yes stop_codon:yes gene_type:complete
MSDNEFRYKISLKGSSSQPTNISPSIYGHLVNCIGLRSTILYVGEVKGSSVKIGVESVSSGWTASSLQSALNTYPTLKDYKILVEDVEAS